MNIIVCGGRNFNEVCAVEHALGVLHARKPITLVVEGGAKGADRLAREWAIKNDIPFLTVEADWKQFGKRAGPIRNRAMIATLKFDGVVAFPGGTGTADMICVAEENGVPVWQPFRL